MNVASDFAPFSHRDLSRASALCSQPTLPMAGLRERIGIVSVLCVILIFIRGASGSTEDPDEQYCSERVSSWSNTQLLALSTLPPISDVSRLKLRDLLFFLHIPRTGGRTFHQCFLKHLFATNERCPRSYDKLRINRSQPGCRLISTHDDYSLLEQVSHEMTSIVTSLRAPVDRVLSSYEFSVEVAARSLRQFRVRAGRPKPLQAPRRPETSKNLDGELTFQRKSSSPPLIPRKFDSRLEGPKAMSTLDIWPWKYLVPTMQEDLFARRRARLSAGASGEEGLEGIVSLLSVNDSYDAAALAMPLHEFIRHPSVSELVHNGATFQVAGLTNTSFAEDAGIVRQCVVRFPGLGKHVLEVAKRRLDRMLYVGLTERQSDASESLLKIVGKQVSLEMTLKSMMSQKRYRSQRIPRVSKLPQKFENLDDLEEEEVAEELLAFYQECVADLRRAQVNRRLISLETIAPIKFTREKRGLISNDILQEVAELNSLDSDLYAHAELLFTQQQNLLARKDFHFKKMKDTGHFSGGNGELDNYEDEPMWDNFPRTFFIAFCSIPVITIAASIVVICVVSKRQGARVKET